MKNKLHSLLTLVVFGITLNISAEDFYKEIKRNFNVRSNVRLNIDINFANINIQTWDQNTIDIVVKMDVAAKDQSRANELFDAIDVNINEGMDLASLSVSAGNSGCNSNNGRSTESSNVRVEVHMPMNAILDGKCAFGDINITDMKGACELNVEYGDLRVNGLWSYENDVHNSFGDARINGTNGGDFHNEYGKLNIGLLQGNAEIKSSFGDMDIDKVSKQCKNLEIDVEYADADINLDSDAGFRFEANSSYGDIDLPDTAKKTSSENDYTSKEIKGTIGNGEGRLDIECDFGDVEIDINQN